MAEPTIEWRTIRNGHHLVTIRRAGEASPLMAWLEAQQRMRPATYTATLGAATLCTPPQDAGWSSPYWGPR